MLQIKNISEFSSVYPDLDWNKGEGTLLQGKPGQRKKLTNDEVNEFHSINIAIGYNGNDFRLSSWVEKKVKFVNLLPLKEFPVQQIREQLWECVNLLKVDENTRERYGVKYLYRKNPVKPIPLVGAFNMLMPLAHSLKQGKTVYLWYLSQHDKSKVDLVVRFLNWFSQQ
ncbi:MAG: hypothetical protein RLZZ338_1426 [Cyanobacteriota bacterium]|jgi:hypothetical protein